MIPGERKRLALCGGNRRRPGSLPYVISHVFLLSTQPFFCDRFLILGKFIIQPRDQDYLPISVPNRLSRTMNNPSTWIKSRTRIMCHHKSRLCGLRDSVVRSGVVTGDVVSEALPSNYPHCHILEVFSSSAAAAEWDSLAANQTKPIAVP